MKFAHRYKEALASEGYPSEWVESAVPYAQLKKCVKKVQTELHRLGLDPQMLSQLHTRSDNNPSARDRNNLSIQYQVDGIIRFVPKLTLFIRTGDDFAVDAVLSPETRRYLEKLATEQQRVKNGSQNPLQQSSFVDSPCDSASIKQDASLDRPGFKRVEIPLTFDAEFFDMLHEDVMALATLRTRQQEALTSDIDALSTQLIHLAQPSAKFKKTDLYRWRQILELYLESEVFFSTHEMDHGSRDSDTASRQLKWFRTEVTRRGLIEEFKLPDSRKALAQFVSINWKLLQNLKFQEINQIAISKIIKKFDKRTQLGATKTFPKLIESTSVLPASMAKAVCAQVSQDIVKIVPQIEDYTCPVCFSIVWRPVRVRCGHLFCIRCTLKLEETHKVCPLCREDVFHDLTIDHLDKDLARYLKKWFPKEVRERQIATETEIGLADFGPTYVHPSERKCAIM